MTRHRARMVAGGTDAHTRVRTACESLTDTITRLADNVGAVRTDPDVTALLPCVALALHRYASHPADKRGRCKRWSCRTWLLRRRICPALQELLYFTDMLRKDTDALWWVLRNTADPGKWTLTAVRQWLEHNPAPFTVQDRADVHRQTPATV